MENIQKLIEFTDLMNEFQKIIRNTLIKNSSRKENDLEHSYRLTMLAWYILDSSESTALNKDLVIKYALIHDFVEIYAGDTFLYTKDEKLKETKPERERESADKLAKKLSDFKELKVLIKNYSDKVDSESKFVYALDKLIPILDIYTDDGRTWKENNVTLDMIIEAKRDKIAFSPEIKPYFDEIIKILKEKENLLFHE